MPITFYDEARRSQGLSYPVFECDYCHRQIEDVEDANVYWFYDEPSRIYFNHKRCAAAHEEALTEAEPPYKLPILSEHLEVFLAQLLGNAGRPEAMDAVDKEGLYKTRGEFLDERRERRGE